ncbi:hypothetical protein [Luteolibacter marinus]|uniref:hypothetical protein n=1 Tax=Luteolibacter marinus TaxID=2776705 RepID=UPI001866DDF5|nr:hypothetical protein [Luteolibacter marinus]
MSSFGGAIFFGSEEWWPVVGGFLFWGTIVGNVSFFLTVLVLRKLGSLEIIYTDADRTSYLYNMGRQHDLMKEMRRRKRGE